MNKIKLLNEIIAVTKNGEIITMAVNLYNDSEFRASFTANRIETDSEIDYNYITDQLTYIMDDYFFRELTTRYDCKPSEIGEYYCNDHCIYNLSDWADNSCLSDIVNIDGTDYFFGAVSCGQCDISEYEILKYTDQKSVEFLIDTWKKHHLHNIAPDILEQVKKSCEILSNIDHDEILKNFTKIYIEKEI